MKQSIHIAVVGISSFRPAESIWGQPLRTQVLRSNHCPQPVVFFANDSKDTATGVAFCNELKIQEDGWAQIAPFGDFPGVAVFERPDGKIIREQAIQRLDKQAAEKMVQNFKSPLARTKRLFAGRPSIFVGHPDMPGMANTYPDHGSKGVIADLAVREDGLYGLPVFTNEGLELVESKQMKFFSGRWSGEEAGEENGKKVFRPDTFISVGLTNRPNLPVKSLINEAEHHMREFLLNLLKGHGITLANDATDEQIQTELNKLGSRVTTLSNEKQTVETNLSTAHVKLTTLTSERDNFRTQFENERQLHIASLLSAAVKVGQITEAERATWKGRLETNFANESQALAKLTPKVKTKSATDGIGERRSVFSNDKDRREQIQQKVQAHMANSKMSYDAAFAKVEKENPDLFKTETE